MIARAVTLRSAIAVLTISLLAGCGSDEASAAPVTVSPGKLTACTDAPFEPFEFTENNQLRGIDVDLVREMASQWKLQAEFYDTDFDNIFSDLESGKCDLVASAVSVTPEREAKYLFSDGYFEVNQSMVVRSADADRFATFDAVKGRSVGVQKGTTGSDYVSNHGGPNTKKVEFEDASELTAALGRNEIDAAVQDFPINSYLAQKDPSLKLVETFTDVERESYGFVMKKDSTALQAATDKSLKEIRKGDQYDEILSRYLGKTVTD